ncbi:expressed unknown protein [Ectocarpus siliculosus]|uniref:Uncharacterized protein n=1 Tax=Ectocarpus siliculosus TaxID=2880 RepID=D8LMM0_ECTSI|nr:expressed unknown protein [Ectocarpus siliculosus]|eukprot:CBN77630.1 expressed unknown protein [Ectocarpus siliculosus]
MSQCTPITIQLFSENFPPVSHPWPNKQLRWGPSLEVRWRVCWRLSPSSQLSCLKLAA